MQTSDLSPQGSRRRTPRSRSRGFRFETKLSKSHLHRQNRHSIAQRMKTSHALLIGILGTATTSHGQTVVFSDDFNRASLGSTWTVAVTAGDGGASIIGSDIMQLTNDATGLANASGRVYVTTPTNAFAAPWVSPLSASPGDVSWTFNLRQIRTDPSGFDSGNYGIAVALASTSSDLTSSDGYAVVLGQSLGIDPIRVVRYSGGLDLNSQLTDVVTASGALSDIGNDFLSLRVTYAPSTNTWSLFGRNDGSSSFSDPQTGTLSAAGTAVDSTLTGSAASTFGVLWSYGTATDQTAFLDNLTITVVPEPSTYALVAGALSLGVVLWRRRQRA